MVDIKKINDFLNLLKKHSKKPHALLIYLLGFTTIRIEIGVYFRGHIELFDNLYIIGIPIIIIGWFYFRNTEKLRLNSLTKIGICFYTEEKENIERVEKIINPIVDQLKRNKNLDFISFIQIEANAICSSLEAQRYLKKNNFNIDNILWLNIDVGNIGTSEKLVIAEGGFSYVNSFNEILFHGVKVNLNAEIDFISIADNVRCINLNQLNEKKALKQNLREIILYYLGIHCLCQLKFEAALKILKEIYQAENSIVNGSFDTERKLMKVELSRENLLAGRLRDLFSKIYNQIAFEYSKAGSQIRALSICDDAIKLLGDSPACYWIFVRMARLNYEINNIGKARYYTSKMQEVGGGETDEVILNNAFFAILDGNIKELICNYKKLNPERLSCIVMEVISFLNDFKTQNDIQENMIKYAVGVLTTYYVDEREGKRQLHLLLLGLKDNKSYLKLKSPILKILSKKYSKRSA